MGTPALRQAARNPPAVAAAVLDLAAPRTPGIDNTNASGHLPGAMSPTSADRTWGIRCSRDRVLPARARATDARACSASFTGIRKEPPKGLNFLTKLCRLASQRGIRSGEVD